MSQLLEEYCLPVVLDMRNSVHGIFNGEVNYAIYSHCYGVSRKNLTEKGRLTDGGAYPGGG